MSNVPTLFYVVKSSTLFCKKAHAIENTHVSLLKNKRTFNIVSCFNIIAGITTNRSVFPEFGIYNNYVMARCQ
jgi:hypothetical protein